MPAIIEFLARFSVWTWPCLLPAGSELDATAMGDVDGDGWIELLARFGVQDWLSFAYNRFTL